MARDVQQENIYERKTKVIKNNGGGGMNSLGGTLMKILAVHIRVQL